MTKLLTKEGTLVWFAALAAGFPLGWLLGLPASSVVTTLLSSMLAALGAASVAVGGLRSAMRAARAEAAAEPGVAARLANIPLVPAGAGEPVLRPRVLSGLIVGVALGATLVQVAKDYDVIGLEHPAARARSWRQAIAADSKTDDVGRRLFLRETSAGAIPGPTIPGTNIPVPGPGPAH